MKQGQLNKGTTSVKSKFDVIFQKETKYSPTVRVSALRGRQVSTGTTVC